MPNLVGGVLVGFAWQFIFCDVFDSIGEILGINWLCDWLSQDRLQLRSGSGHTV